jgi:hypothetical protein
VCQQGRKEEEDEALPAVNIIYDPGKVGRAEMRRAGGAWRSRISESFKFHALMHPLSRPRPSIRVVAPPLACPCVWFCSALCTARVTDTPWLLSYPALACMGNTYLYIHNQRRIVIMLVFPPTCPSFPIRPPNQHARSPALLSYWYPA